MAQLLGAILVLFAIFMVTGVILALVGAAIVLFAAAVAIAILVGICKGIAQVRREHRAERLAREQAEQTRLRHTAERAEREHQLYIRGDSQGIYGKYPPIDLDRIAEGGFRRSRPTVSQVAAWTWREQARRAAEPVPVKKKKHHHKKKKRRKHQ